MFDPKDYPAVTYQHVVDVSDLFAQCPAIPEMRFESLYELGAFAEALAKVFEVGVAQGKAAAALGFNPDPDDPYQGSGVHFLLEGPGMAQVLVVGSHKMGVADVPQGVIEGMFAEGGPVDGPIEVQPTKRLGVADVVMLTEEERAEAVPSVKWLDERQAQAVKEAAKVPGAGFDEEGYCTCDDCRANRGLKPYPDPHGFGFGFEFDEDGHCVCDECRAARGLDALWSEELAADAEAQPGRSEMAQAAYAAMEAMQAEDEIEGVDEEQYHDLMAELSEAKEFEAGQRVRVIHPLALVPLSSGADIVEQGNYRDGQWYEVVNVRAPFVGTVHSITSDTLRMKDNERVPIYSVGPDWAYYGWQLEAVEACVCDLALDACDGSHAVCKGDDV